MESEVKEKGERELEDESTRSNSIEIKMGRGWNTNSSNMSKDKQHTSGHGMHVFCTDALSAPCQPHSDPWHVPVTKQQRFYATTTNCNSSTGAKCA